MGGRNEGKEVEGCFEIHEEELPQSTYSLYSGGGLCRIVHIPN